MQTNCCGEDLLTETYRVAAALVLGDTPMVRITFAGRTMSGIEADGSNAPLHDHAVLLQSLQARDIAQMILSMADRADAHGEA